MKKTNTQMSSKLSAILNKKFGDKYQIHQDPTAYNVLGVMRNGKHVATYHIPSEGMSAVQPNAHLIDMQDYSGLIYETEDEMA